METSSASCNDPARLTILRAVISRARKGGSLRVKSVIGRPRGHKMAKAARNTAASLIVASCSGAMSLAKAEQSTGALLLLREFSSADCKWICCSNGGIE